MFVNMETPRPICVIILIISKLRSVERFYKSKSTHTDFFILLKSCQLMPTQLAISLDSLCETFKLFAEEVNLTEHLLYLQNTRKNPLNGAIKN